MSHLSAHWNTGRKKCSVNGVNEDTGTPYYYCLVQLTNVYAAMSESGAGLGHEWKPTTIDEIVHWSGVATHHGSLDG